MRERKTRAADPKANAYYSNEDEFKSTDERTRVYYIVHLHGRDDEKKKISKQSRGCSFESDE